MLNRTLFIVASIVFVMPIEASQPSAGSKRPADTELEGGSQSKKTKSDAKAQREEAQTKHAEEWLERDQYLQQQYDTANANITYFQNMFKKIINVIDSAIAGEVRIKPKSIEKRFNTMKSGCSKFYDAFLPASADAQNSQAQPITYVDNIYNCIQKFEAVLETQNFEKEAKELQKALTEYNDYLSTSLSISFPELEAQDIKEAHEETQWNIPQAWLPAVVGLSYTPIMQWCKNAEQSLKNKHKENIIRAAACEDEVIDSEFYGSKRTALYGIAVAHLGQALAKATNDDRDVECALFADGDVRFLVNKKAYADSVYFNAHERALLQSLHHAYNKGAHFKVAQLLLQSNTIVRNPRVRENLRMNYECDKVKKEQFVLRQKVLSAASQATATCVASTATAAAK